MSAAPDLLTPEFIAELEALRRRLEIRARSGASGERVSRRRGGSAEFEEHRPYAPGDDLRRIDWLAYARTGEPVIKQFRAEEDVILRMLVDGSASLGFGEPSKLEVARRLCAALGYLALAGSQRAQVLVAGGQEGRGPGLNQVGPPKRGRSALAGLLRELSRVEATGTVDLTRSIEQTLLTSRRPGLLVVVSDFYDAGPVLQALGRARAQGHDVCLLQVLSREELEPNLEGDYSFVDAESGQTVELTLDATAVDAYIARLTGLIEELRGWARRHAGTYLRAVTDEPLEAVVRRFVTRESD
ncbi:MAG: DUF58 domain-containing protein [Polyangiaceae bacterium]|nr:DUF58 domain-containing protein [Polyangiaceae bacterium]MCB9607914.1 DUF58 domain-containing protein [Polyangiaceae bacterium]